MLAKQLFALTLALLLSGCSMLSPVKAPTMHTYILNRALNVAPVKTPEKLLTILVTEPQSLQPYNTNAMAYVDHPYQLSYFSENQWADTPAQMLLPLMVQSLQDTHAFKAVVSYPYVNQTDVILNTQLLKLQQNFLTRPSQEELILRAQLVNAISNQVIATTQFTFAIPVKENTPYGGVIAANAASSRLMNHLSVWVISSTAHAK